MPIEALLARAIAVKTASALSVKWTHADGVTVRHCKDVADRDAFIARCVARGEQAEVVS